MTLPIGELGRIINDDLPMVMVDAVSSLSPIFSQTREGGGGVVGNYAELPIIAQKEATSGLGPRRNVVLAGNLSGAAYVPGAPNAPGGARTGDQAHAWATFHASFSLTKFDRLALESGTLRVAGYMDMQTKHMAESIARAINLSVWTGLAQPNLDGLNTLGINGAVYGGIVRALEPNHQPFIDTAGAPRNITTAVLDFAWDTFTQTVEYNEGRWFGATSPAQMTALRALVLGSPAWQSSSEVKLLGQRGIRYNGIPIFAFPGFPNNCIDFYNADGLAWEFQGDVPFHVDADWQYVGDTYTRNVYCHPQICLENPRKNAMSIDQLV
jgi:hypothetical protein